MVVLLLALRHGDASLDAVLGINKWGGGSLNKKKEIKSNEDISEGHRCLKDEGQRDGREG